jgi:hypothetical protein
MWLASVTEGERASGLSGQRRGAAVPSPPLPPPVVPPELSPLLATACLNFRSRRFFAGAIPLGTPAWSTMDVYRWRIARAQREITGA